MSRKYHFTRTCDRCFVTVVLEFEDADSRDLPQEYTLHKDWAQIGGEAYEKIDLCPECKVMFREWMADGGVKND